MPQLHGISDEFLGKWNQCLDAASTELTRLLADEQKSRIKKSLQQEVDIWKIVSFTQLLVRVKACESINKPVKKVGSVATSLGRVTFGDA
jgi:hypothetical protein